MGQCYQLAPPPPPAPPPEWPLVDNPDRPPDGVAVAIVVAVVVVKSLIAWLRRRPARSAL
jgi:hypothetical protein